MDHRIYAIHVRKSIKYRYLGGRPAMEVDCLLSRAFLCLIGLISLLSTVLSGLK